jgi:hypothetical protein
MVPVWPDSFVKKSPNLVFLKKAQNCSHSLVSSVQAIGENNWKKNNKVQKAPGSLVDSHFAFVKGDQIGRICAYWAIV